jgi:hypothetical protein
MGSLDLAVQVWCPRPDVDVADVERFQMPVEMGLKFGAIVAGVEDFQHANAAGDLIHIDTKKLGRIERMSHRVTGNRRDTMERAGLLPFQ